MLKTLLVLGALAVGIALGMAIGGNAPGLVNGADVVGSLWLRGLQMTVVPLVVTLLVTGILRTAQMASAERLTVRAIATRLVGVASSTFFSKA
jgi:Na+/H+-dicarboxylate symporter